MALSNELISQFAKLTNNVKKEDTGAEVKGTFVTIGGVEYVRLDGSEILTPVTTAVEAVPDERVVVLIKDHMAQVIKNITSPAARNKSVEDIKDEVDEFGNTIQQMDNTIIQQNNSIIQMNNAINQQNVTINQHDTLINQQGDTIVSLNNTIVQQGNQISSMNNTVVEQGNNIISMNNTINQQGDHINSMNNIISQQGNTIEQQGNAISQQGNQINQFGDVIESLNNDIVVIDNTVRQYGNQILELDNTVRSYDNIIYEQGNQITSIGNVVNTQGSNIIILNSAFKIVDGVLIGLSEILVDKLIADELNAVYADIDFSNIQTAAIENLFAESGIIKDLVMKEGHVTGELVGVTIKGDLIEGNTIKADKLVVRGEDGLYYKLNVSGEKIETEQTNENSLNGQVIAAKSITASKITVDDLVAFGATIAGFIIDNFSIHSDTKGSIESDAKGIYLDKDGQFYLGDSADHVKYYKNEDGEFILDIRASQIFIGTGGETVGELFNNVNNTTNDLRTFITQTNVQLQQTTDSLSTRIESNTSIIAETNSDLDASNKLADERYTETVSQISETQQRVDQITNIFQITGGTNLLKNSVWFYKTLNIPNDWVINGATIFDGGQDDNLIGTTISRGKIEIRNGSVQSSNGNIINILTNRAMGISFKYKNGLNTTSKISLYAGTNTDAIPLWTKTITENTNNTFVQVTDNIISTTPNYVLKIESTTPTGDGKFTVSDFMINYGDHKGWELAAGEVFGAIIKLNNQGIQVTSDTANTETYMTTNGVDIFNKTTTEKVTTLTDTGVETKNLYSRETIKQKKMMHTTIKNSNGIEIYVEYIED